MLTMEQRSNAKLSASTNAFSIDQPISEILMRRNSAETALRVQPVYKSRVNLFYLAYSADRNIHKLLVPRGSCRYEEYQDRQK